jgi:hypothetical protein
LRSDDTVLRIENLTYSVGAAQICPGPRLFSKGETPLLFQKEFLLPGESQDFSIVFVNAAKKAISFTPKVLVAHAVASAPSAR